MENKLPQLLLDQSKYSFIQYLGKGITKSLVKYNLAILFVPTLFYIAYLKRPKKYSEIKANLLIAPLVTLIAFSLVFRNLDIAYTLLQSVYLSAILLPKTTWFSWYMWGVLPLTLNTYTDEK